MNIWERATLTNKGIALLTKLHSGTTLSLTRAVAGAGTTDIDTLENETSVADERQELVFSTQSYPEEGMCAVPLKLYNTEVSAGYIATQIGVYAFDPDEGEILFLIAQAKTGKGTEVPSNDEMPGYVSVWTFYIEYGKADGVTITVNPAGSVTPEDVTGIVQKYIKENLGNVDNTSDASKNVAFASEAGLARKVENGITIRFKGGQTEGTDKWTFDGSTSKSVNITPEKIGAAAESHGHSYNDLTDKPTIPAAYTHPAYTKKTSGLYKITVDDTGHVSGATPVAKSDITALGIPGSDTHVTVDSEIDSNSTNPVQNKVVKAALDERAPNFFFKQVALSAAALDMSSYKDTGLYLFTSPQNITIGSFALGTKTLLAYVYGYEEDHETSGSMILTYRYFYYLRDIATGITYKLSRRKASSDPSFSYTYTESKPAYET